MCYSFYFSGLDFSMKLPSFLFDTADELLPTLQFFLAEPFKLRYPNPYKSWRGGCYCHANLVSYWRPWSGGSSRYHLVHELYVAITDKIPVIVDRPSMMILPSWIPATHDAFVHCLHTNIIASYEYSLGQNCTATRPGHSIWHVVYGVHACQQKKPNMWDFVFCG